MQRVEFKRPGGIIRSIEEMEEDEKEFAKIANILTQLLGWKLVDRIEVDVLLWHFRKDDIEIILAYNDMDGMYLRTSDETFDLDALFEEINDIMYNCPLPFLPSKNNASNDQTDKK